MTGTLNPQAAFVVCACGHTQRRHFEQEGQCEAGGCGCGLFRSTDQVIEPAATPPAVVPPAPVASSEARPSTPPATTSDHPRLGHASHVHPRLGHASHVVDGQRQPAPANPAGNVLEAARKSSKQGTRALGLRIETQLADLRQRVRDEQETEAQRAAEAKKRAEARARLAELDKEAAELRAILGGSKKPKPPTPPTPTPASAPEPVGGAELDPLGRSYATGQYPCPAGCGREFDSKQAVTMHRLRAHGKLQGAVRGSNSNAGRAL